MWDIASVLCGPLDRDGKDSGTVVPQVARTCDEEKSW